MDHPCQRELAPRVEAVWLAALEDAGFAAEDSLLYLFDGPRSARGYSARGLRLQREDDLPELFPLLDEMNESVDAVRVVVWSERSFEGLGAAMRHELEHARQYEMYGQRLLELHGVAEAVLSERVGGLCGGGVLYQLIPDEMDAQAAAASFVRGRFGDERVDELLRLSDEDGAPFRSLVPATSLESLPERMLLFLAMLRDLCEQWADRSGFPFPTLLDLHWAGSGAVWQRLAGMDEWSVPR